jgi:hypothetical protein
MYVLMPKLFGRFRRLWHHSSWRSTVLVPFAVSCACGHTLTGRRRREHQVLRCPACGADVFILPRSPLPAVHDAQGTSAPPVRRASPARLALAAGCVLLALAGTYWACVSFLWPQRHASAALTPGQAEHLARQHWDQAREHIALGHFALALGHLNAVDDLQRQFQTAWIDPHRLARQRREIALYVDLLHDSLEELLAEAADLPDPEWEQQFRKRYQGKAVLFDDLVTRRADGTIHGQYDLHAAGQAGTLDFSNLPFFHTLKPGLPQRVLFGARLKSIGRTGPGSWLVQFWPDSLVLLTDPEALAISCPDLADADTRLLLAKQAQEPG